MQNNHNILKNFFIYLILETSALDTRLGNNLKFHLEKQTHLEKPSRSTILSKQRSDPLPLTQGIQMGRLPENKIGDFFV